MSRVLPVVFNTDMVRAILDGRKTVTRRVAKKIPAETNRIELVQPFDGGNLKFECHWGGYMPDVQGFKDGMAVVKPPYQLGDILYVRESYCPNYFDEGLSGYRSGDNMRGNRNAYKADYHKEIVGDVVPEPKWKPSIHMPKDAARIWLKVTDVRVERLQDIDEEQAEKEGGINNIGFIHSPENEYENLHTAREDFKENIWNATIKKSDIDRYGWDANPWVWVIGFERCEKPSESP